MTQYIGAPGLEQIALLLNKKPAQLRKASRLAQAAAARKAKTAASRRIREQAALKKGYVDGKLSIRWANEDVSLVAERRGLLMNRYSHKTVKQKGKAAGYRVKLRPNKSASHFRHFFTVPLRRGKVDGGNGVAFAQRNGTDRGSFHVVYAPSVSQELNWVMEELAEEILPVLRSETIRQLERA